MLATAPGLYYNLKSCQYLGAQQPINHLVAHYLNHTEDYRTDSFLTSSQQDLFNLIEIVKSQYDFRTTLSTPIDKLINRIHKLIKRDAFIHLISSLTSQQFSKLISEDRGYQLFFKLMFFSYLMTQLKVMRQLNKDAQQCLNTCQHYLKVIQNQPDFYHTFIDNFYKSTQMSINDKLFYSRIIFPSDLPNKPFSKLIEQFQSHWRNQFLFLNQTNDHSELPQLLFGF